MGTVELQDIGSPTKGQIMIDKLTDKNNTATRNSASSRPTDMTRAKKAAGPEKSSSKKAPKKAVSKRATKPKPAKKSLVKPNESKQLSSKKAAVPEKGLSKKAPKKAASKRTTKPKPAKKPLVQPKEAKQLSSKKAAVPEKGSPKKAPRKAVSKRATKPKPTKKSLIKPNELKQLSSKKGLVKLLKRKGLGSKRVLADLHYEQDLRKLQMELVKLQRSVQQEGRRVAIIFEGRDAAGKGGAIRRFMEHLNPRTARVIALPKPTEVQAGQWYFQRYIAALPNPGEICFFDRSWYNRAVVEPVMGFCKPSQYQSFLQQVPEFEHMLYEDGVELIKFWFSISKEEQASRFSSRRGNPLKQWKISPVDEEAQERWDVYSKYKMKMFERTHTSFSPWIVVGANTKKRARLESIRYVLSTLDYEGKDTPNTDIGPDPKIIRRYHRSVRQLD